MPTYEYRCRDCGHTFDIVQKMSDDPLTHCPECGGELRKVFAPPAISFKGSGFYATDHGKKSKRAGESKKDGDKKPASTDGGSTKKETTPSDSSSSATTKKEGSS
jgi:putative FmdB family regulatory protein